MNEGKRPDWDDRIGRASNAAWNASHSIGDHLEAPELLRRFFQGLAAILHELDHDEPKPEAKDT